MYEDIINLPHHVSGKRPQMSMQDRAAQFSTFAALTAYADAVTETGSRSHLTMYLTSQAIYSGEWKNNAWMRL